MLKKQRKNVPVATAEKPIEPVAPESPATDEDKQVAEEIIQAKPLTDKQRLDNIEAQLTQANANFQQIGVFIEKMNPLVALSEQIAQRQANPQPATAPPSQMGGLDLSSIGAVLKEVLGSGGTDNELAQLGKDALKSQIAMSTAITNAVVSKITGKAVVEVAEALVST